ncbi:MAG: caspase family protein [Anaerolineae bacterium]
MSAQDQSPRTSPPRRALLIGINKYPQLGPGSQLHGCVQDILDVRGFLVDHAGFPAESVHLLLSELDGRTLPPGLGTIVAPDAIGIRQALKTLGDGVSAGDEVIVYYSGHGVRISNPQNASEQIGAIAAMDVRFDANSKLVTDTLIINRELNKAIQALLEAGAIVTAVLDSCHSGGATRDLGDENLDPVREIIGEISPDGWQELLTQHGADIAGVAATGTRGFDLGGPATSLSEQQNLIVLSGCRDTETSKEFPRVAPTNGALTYFLLDSLRNVKADETGAATWQSLYPQVRQSVNSAYSDQTPTLEGRAERPLFGGSWRPYAPGFTVTAAPGGSSLRLDGGSLHGLGPGAQVAIYPPGTSDFAGVAPQAVAQVDDAELVTSRAHVISGASAIANLSRARLIKPADRAARVGVQLTDVPDAIVQAIRQAPGINDFVTLNPDKARPDYEVCPNPRGDGWVLVPYRSTKGEPGPNEVIAQVPGLNIESASSLGTALGLGLVQWARYWAVLTRRNTDDSLRNALSLTLLAGDDSQAMFNNPNDPKVARPVAPNAAGVCQVGMADNLMLKVKVSPTCSTNLAVGVLVCSNDGNIFRLWPPANAESNMAPGDEKIIGYGSDLRAFKLRVDRPEQTESLYTFKAFATNAATAIDLGSLEQQQTVQDVVDAALPSRGADRGGLDAGTARAPRVLWTTVELPVLVQKSAP